MKKIIIKLILLSTLAFADNLIAQNKGNYPILTGTINTISHNYFNNFTKLQIDSCLTSALEKRFHLGIKTIKKYNKIKITVNNKQTIIHRPDYYKLDQFCDIIKPEITSILKNYNLDINYDLYLSDILASELNPYSSVADDQNFLHTSDTSYSSSIPYIINKAGNFIISKNVLDIDGKTINLGAKIIEINKIPIQYLTKMITDELFFFNRTTKLELKIEFEHNQKTIFYKDNNIPQDNLISKTTENGICIIKFTSYINYGSANRIKKILLKDSASIKAIVLDLRGNPGGSLLHAIGITALFLNDSLLIATLKKKNSRDFNYISDKAQICKGKKIIILTDSLTASGAEIIAGVLQHYNRAEIIGQKTMGYGAIQNFFPVDKNYWIKIEMAKLVTASKYKFGIDPIIPNIIKNDFITDDYILSLFK